MCEVVGPSSDELSLVNTEIDLTVGKVVRNEVEAMSTCKYNLVASLFNQNSPAPKTSSHLSSYSLSQGVIASHSASSKRKLNDENDLNVGNEIFKQVITEKESPQAYGPPLLKNLASKFWQTEAKNGQIIEKTGECLLASNYPYVPTLTEEIIKNKKIHHYCKRNDKRWFNLQSEGNRCIGRYCQFVLGSR